MYDAPRRLKVFRSFTTCINSLDNGSNEGCVTMASPSLTWKAMDCMLVKDFICEQTRCYYYNYGSIPVSATQGNRRLYFNNSTMTTISTMTATMSTTKATGSIPTDYDIFKHNETKKTPTFEQDFPEKLTEVSTSTEKIFSQMHLDEVHNKNLILKMLVTENLKNNSRPIHLPHITSLFTESSVSNDNVFAGLQTHEIRSIVRTSIPTKQMITKSQPEQETESTNNTFEDNYTIGPYDSNNQDYQSDQSELMLFQKNQQQYSQKNFDDDSSTILPEAEPSYRYNIKVRNYGKVLDPLFN
ncbi:PREDICTED: uncharacterized protein LOC105366546 isoform X3 [Ceratosolen solmsi marchali]|uniref:Uncharacterized protein LOC105366546 isoform X3 n=1 Tax=Ceratosolen solmsi marchali TaxID=326594 RepID=A0AAJ6YSE6_9HYME|nr:PREDICTED: uncharacterized protein LOC105366546 isoform X3 [Ceratosolen solmsi marchali]